MKKLQVLLISILVFSAPVLAEPTQNRTVYLLQDAHDSLSAQEQIAQAISNLVNQRDIQLVATEGWDGVLPENNLKTLAPSEKLSQAAHNFLKSGTIGGVEYAYLSNRRLINLFGAEDESLYHQDLDLYRGVLDDRAFSARLLNKIEKLLDKNADSGNHQETLKAQQLLNSLYSSQFLIVDWFRQLDPLLRWQRISIPENSTYARLRELLSASGQNRDARNQAALMRSMNTRDMQNEFQHLIWKLRLAMAHANDEKNRIYLKWQLSLIRRMCEGELTPNDAGTLARLSARFDFKKGIFYFIQKKNPEELNALIGTFKDLDPILERDGQFYTLARLRSFVMAERLLRQMNRQDLSEAVLIAGGFHARDFENYFRTKGVRVITWSPKFDEKDIKLPSRENILAMKMAGSTIRAWLFGGDIPVFENQMKEELQILGAVFSGHSLGKAEEAKSFFEKYKKTKPDDGMKALFDSSELADRILSLHKNLSGRLEFDRGAEDGFYPDIFFFAMDDTVRAAEETDVAQALQKIKALRQALEPKAPPVLSEKTKTILLGRDPGGALHFYGNREAWGRFWDNDLFTRFFSDKLSAENFKQKSLPISIPYQQGDAPKKLLEKKVRELEGTARLEFYCQTDALSAEDLEATVDDFVAPGAGGKFSEMSAEKANTAGEIQAVFKQLDAEIIPDQKTLSALLDQAEVFASDLAKLQKNLGGQREIYQDRLRTASKTQTSTDRFQIIRSLSPRSWNVTTLGKLVQIFTNHVLNPDATVEEGLTHNLGSGVGRFLLSPSFGLFQVDEKGRVENWEDALVAYMNYLLASKIKTVDFKPEVNGFPPRSEAPEGYDSLLRQAWKLYVPAIGYWELKYSMLSVEDEMGESKDLKLNAVWLNRERFPMENAEDESSYVIVSGESFVNVNPFLRLNNSSKQFALFRISAPGSGRETAELISDPYQRNLIAGALLAGVAQIETNEPFLFDPQTGMLEVDQMDPVAKIKSIFNQMKRAAAGEMEEGEMQMLYRGKHSMVQTMHGMSAEDQGLFEEVPGRKFGKHFTFDNPGAKKNKVKLDAARSLFKPFPAALKPAAAVQDNRENKEALASLAISKTNKEQMARTKLVSGKGELTVTFVSGSGIVLRPYSFNLILQGEEAVQSFTREETLGFQGQGKYILAAAAQYLEAQNLSAADKLLYDSWRPYLLEVYRKTRGEAKGKSLGEAGQEKPAATKGLSVFGADEFMFAERLSSKRDLWNQTTQKASLPCELLVYYSAFKKGILFPNLNYLLGKFQGLKITVVDDKLNGKEIYQDLKRRDPNGILAPFLLNRQLVIPDHPELSAQVKAAEERLTPDYKQYNDSALGIIFSDQDGMSAREMVLRTPKRSMRFVAQGNLDLGVVAGAALALIRGTTRDLFESRYQDEDVFVLSPMLPEALNDILTRYAAQIQLQTSA